MCQEEEGQQGYKEHDDLARPIRLLPDTKGLFHSPSAYTSPIESSDQTHAPIYHPCLAGDAPVCPGIFSMCFELYRTPLLIVRDVNRVGVALIHK